MPLETKKKSISIFKVKVMDGPIEASVQTKLRHTVVFDGFIILIKSHHPIN